MPNHQSQTASFEKRLLLQSAIWPFVFVILILLVKLVEELLGSSFSQYGLMPKSISGLAGVLTYPFLHKDFSHMFSNAVPLLFLGTALFYFYRRASGMIFLQLFLISGIWLWFLAKEGSVHIGASGLVYGLTAFHVTSGFIKRNHRLLAFALLVLFLYGSLVWGVFPDFFPKRNISWEGHLTGMAAGVLLAWFHRRQGPERDKYSWEEEDEDKVEVEVEVEDKVEVEVENEDEIKDEIKIKNENENENDLWGKTGKCSVCDSTSPGNEHEYSYKNTGNKNAGL